MEGVKLLNTVSKIRCTMDNESQRPSQFPNDVRRAQVMMCLVNLNELSLRASKRLQKYISRKQHGIQG